MRILCLNRLKWYGEDRQKLLILRDDEQQNLNERMQSEAATSVNTNPTSGIENYSEEINMAELHEVHDNSNVNDKSIRTADNENLLVAFIRN